MICTVLKHEPEKKETLMYICIKCKLIKSNNLTYYRLEENSEGEFKEKINKQKIINGEIFC